MAGTSARSTDCLTRLRTNSVNTKATFSLTLSVKISVSRHFNTAYIRVLSVGFYSSSAVTTAPQQLHHLSLRASADITAVIIHIRRIFGTTPEPMYAIYAPGMAALSGCMADGLGSIPVDKKERENI